MLPQTFKTQQCLLCREIQVAHASSAAWHASLLRLKMTVYSLHKLSGKQSKCSWDWSRVPKWSFNLLSIAAKHPFSCLKKLCLRSMNNSACPISSSKGQQHGQYWAWRKCKPIGLVLCLVLLQMLRSGRPPEQVVELQHCMDSLTIGKTAKQLGILKAYLNSSDNCCQPWLWPACNRGQQSPALASSEDLQRIVWKVVSEALFGWCAPFCQLIGRCSGCSVPPAHNVAYLYDSQRCGLRLNSRPTSGISESNKTHVDYI